MSDILAALEELLAHEDRIGPPPDDMRDEPYQQIGWWKRRHESVRHSIRLLIDRAKREVTA